MTTKDIYFQQNSSTEGETSMDSMNNTKLFFKDKAAYTEQVKVFCLFALAFLAFTPEAFGVANTNDAGLNQSTTNLVGIINNSLVPITLIAGCLAAAGLAFMKSSPTPFIVAVLTTISFGFAKVWINTTYAICV
ncbi:MAG: hypothetical protein KBD36_03170 [Alphaproteobacteria bacterium]|jgi:hypothetical protein|nr:hypothetical protein [Alphaproteobacteria bacterium]MBP9776826.1 hypothetical protein [Alphaproteobacteria bacterium]